jgi:hypothetical protein
LIGGYNYDNKGVANESNYNNDPKYDWYLERGRKE